MEDVFNIIKSLETELFFPATRQDAARLSELLSDDFEEYGKSGKVYSKSEIIAALVNEQATEIEYSDFSFIKITDSAVLAKYKTCCNGVKANRSSVWVKKNNQWQMLHHQGTKTE